MVLSAGLLLLASLIVTAVLNGLANVLTPEALREMAKLVESDCRTQYENKGQDADYGRILEYTHAGSN